MNTQHRSGFKSRNRGFTMIEALIAFVVLAAGMLALLSFQGTTQKTNAEAKVQSEATAFAEAKLEELRSYLEADDDRFEGSSDSKASQIATFQRTWEVEDVGDIKIATVTVTWDDRDGNEQAVILSSEIYAKDPVEGLERFSRIYAQAANEAEDDPAEWIGGGGGGLQRKVVERVLRADMKSDSPLLTAYPDTQVFYIYAVTISGSITRQNQNLFLTSLGITGPSITTIAGVGELIVDVNGNPVLDADGNPTYTVSYTHVYTPSCIPSPVASSSTSYSCVGYYLSTSSGWGGSIAYGAVSGARFCGAANPTPVTNFTKNYSSTPLINSTVLNIRLAESVGGCNSNF